MATFEVNVFVVVSNNTLAAVNTELPIIVKSEEPVIAPVTFK